MKDFFSRIGWWLIPLAVFLIVFGLTRFVFFNTYVPSGSMKPAIETGDSVIGYRLAYKNRTPERGDIIIFHNPDNETWKYVKRVIGLPGETVSIRDGITYINGKALKEPYLKEPPAKEDFGPYFVPKNSYFCLGDNRNRSTDSRYWNNTFVPLDKIIAKAVFTCWPVSHIGVVK